MVQKMQKIKNLKTKPVSNETIFLKNRRVKHETEHGLFCVRKRNTIICVERTKNGHEYAYLIYEFVKMLDERGSRETKKYLKEKRLGEEYMCGKIHMIDFRRWYLGKKMIEINAYRPRKQKYAIMFDLNKNTVYINIGVIEVIGSIERLCELRRQLKKHRWKIEMGEDIEDLLTDEELDMYTCEPEDLEENPMLQKQYEVKMFYGTSIQVKEVVKHDID